MRVVVYGFGEIGKLVAKSAHEVGLNVVGAVDINPEIVGKKLEDFGIKSAGTIKDSFDFDDVDLVFLTTSSYLDEVYPQIEECVENKCNIISSCETLTYPEYRYPELARKINQIAIENGVSVLGAGINPGFLLDFLPCILSATSIRVSRVRAIRSADALKRRKSFWKKIGLNLTIDEVKRKLGKELTGHVGYAESVCLIAETLGFTLERIEEGQEIVSNDGKTCLGLRGHGVGIANGKEVIRVEFHAYAGAEEFEEILIEGDNTTIWKSTGTKGDLGTVNVLVNLARFVRDSKPGLIKISDLVPFKRI